MTKEPMRERAGGPAWHLRPSPFVTALDAEPGTVRTDSNGTQWWYDAGRGWQPVIIGLAARSHEPEPEPEAG